MKRIIFFSCCWKATPTRAFNEFFNEFLRFFLISKNSLKFANFFGWGNEFSIYGCRWQADLTASCQCHTSVMGNFLQCFDTVGWVIWPVKTRPRYDLCVWWDVKPYSTNQWRVTLRGWPDNPSGWADTTGRPVGLCTMAKYNNTYRCCTSYSCHIKSCM